jgi:hypothetical protein
VKVVTRVQDVFVVTKVLALGIIVVAGVVYIAQGNLKNLERPMEGSSTEPGLIALSFYSGLFSYAGWHIVKLQKCQNFNIKFCSQELFELCHRGAERSLQVSRELFCV